MENLTINQLQEYLKLKYYTYGNATNLFMKLVEEVGETAEALNQLDGRKKDDGTALLEEELADIIHYTVAIAAISDINLAEAIIEKDKVASIKYKQEPNLEEFIKRG